MVVRQIGKMANGLARRGTHRIFLHTRRDRICGLVLLQMEQEFDALSLRR